MNALGQLETESYLSSVRVSVGFYTWAVTSNALRRYRQSVAAALDGVRALEADRARFGFDEDASELRAAVLQLETVSVRHGNRTDPPAVTTPDGRNRRQLPSQLPPFSGHGEWLGNAELETLNGLAAALGAAQWFERCSSEGSAPLVKLRPALLFITAVAVGLEPPTKEAHALKGAAIDRAQRRWGKRLMLIRRNGKSRLTGVVGEVWALRSDEEQSAIRADIRRLRSAGRPIEALARERLLGLHRDGGNLSTR